MGLFKKKPRFSRPELREHLRKASGQIPGSSRRYSIQERVKLEKEFESKYGHQISKLEAKRELREQRRLRAAAKTYDEKMARDRKMRYLKNLFGIKKF